MSTSITVHNIVKVETAIDKMIFGEDERLVFTHTTTYTDEKGDETTIIAFSEEKL